MRKPKKKKATEEEKLKYLERMAGTDDVTTGKVPMPGPDGEPLDEDKYWIEFRWPNAEETDELTAALGKTYQESTVTTDDADTDFAELDRKTFVEPRLFPFLDKLVDLGLIDDGALPEKKDGEFVPHSMGTEDDKKFLRRGGYTRATVVYQMAVEALLSDEVEVVVDEGEESSTDSDTSSNEMNLPRDGEDT